ncbi:AAA family ATPase [Mycolicibacter sp. MYC098]|uniref:AAA family ATPase n=1 Tax=[Mycobacterium] crassicus TaxID=2872309 RepID=A0ABU5XMZ2_9MYCO|nr:MULTISPECIES: AAA family ATPase [unclassified Mycolicibacter]MEB3023358.1 AAA family ATPase [Mycolicibacter sp. MYC098]
MRPSQDLLRDPITAEVVLGVWSGDPAVTVPAPPGSGKTRLTVHLADLLADRAGLRVGIAAQTRAQATEIACRLAKISDRAMVGLLWKASGVRPDSGDCPIITGRQQIWPAGGGAVRVATSAKWLSSEPERLAADVLIVDEAYQCTYADLCALGAMTAGQVVLVGDSGQIAPVVTGDVSRWEDSPTGPHLPAPIALAAAHGDAVTTIALRHTWRLGPVTTRLVSDVFYADMPFTSRRPAEHVSLDGVVLPELAHRVLTAPDGPTSSSVAAAAVDRVRTLLAGGALTTGEGTRPLLEADVAVVVPHVSQAAAIRAMLADHPGVLCGTANALQGLERAAVVAVHPMVGKRTADPFSIDAARLCVMLSRHRCHLTVLVDAYTPTVWADNPEDGVVARSAGVMDRLLATPAA